MIMLRTLACLALSLGLAACTPGAYGPGAEEATGDTPQACPDTIEIRDFAFEPEACAVEPGTTLTFRNADDAPHTATSQEGPASFDTGTLQPGESATVTLDATGSYDYLCEIHPSMQASILVRGGETASAADEDATSSSGYGRR